jgi:RNA polymerase sigma factor (sigma-70 family)
MSSNIRERAHWLARNVLPHEPLIRARLKKVYVADLDIDDVIQEMYARILSVPNLESIRYPRQYAIQTAKSIIIDHLRRLRVVSIRFSGSLEKLDIAALETSTEERLEFQDEIQEVADALLQLPKVCRETLILRRVEGLSQKEAARRLGVSEKKAEYYLARGALLLVNVFGRGGKSRSRSSKIEGVQVSSEDGTLKRAD